MHYYENVAAVSNIYGNFLTDKPTTLEQCD